MATSKGFNFIFGADTSKFSKAIESMNKQISKTTTALKQLNTATKLDPSNTSAYVAKQQALQQQIEETKTKLTRLNEEMKTMVSTAEKTGTAIDGNTWAKYQQEVAKTEQQLKELREEFTKVSTGADQVSDKLNQAGEKLQTAGSKIQSAGSAISGVGSAIMPASVAVTAIGTAGLKVAADFEEGMSKVKAISGATGSEFDALRDKAIELGADTAFSSSEVAEAMTEMAKAGWSSQQILDGMSGVLDAAAASGEELGTVSTIVADAITTFNLEASESSRVADLLTEAANAGTIDIADLGESFKNCGPMATSMGFSIEETTTALEALSTAGIKGADAGTGLKSMLSQLIKPSNSVQGAMDALGITIANSDGSMKSLSEILAEMRVAFSGLTEEEKNYYATTIAGRNGVSSMLTLLNMSQEEYDELSASMENCSGIAGETASVMQDNLNNKVEQLTGALESLAIKLADNVIPFLSDLTEKATGVVDKFTEMDEGTQQLVLTIGAIVAAAGPVLVMVGTLVEKTGVITKAIGELLKEGGALNKGITKLVGFIGKLTAPMIALIALIGLVVAAIIYLWNNNEDFRNNMTNLLTQLWEQIQSTVSTITECLQQLWNDFLKPLWETYIKPFLEQCANWLQPFIETVMGTITGILSGAFDIIEGLVKFITGLVTGDFEMMGEGLGQTFGGIANVITTIFTGIWSFLSSIVSTITSVVTGAFSGLWNIVTAIFDNIAYAITHPIETAKNTISNIVDTIKGFFNGFHISLPHINLPHFYISPRGWQLGDLLKGKIPTLGIDWYAKAMDKPMVLDGATIFGAMNGQLLGGGEAGREVITSEKDYYNTRNRTNVTNNITIVQKEGEDSNALAKRVARILTKDISKEDGVFA